MANQEENKALLGFGIYVGVVALFYFLLESFSRVKWLKFSLTLLFLAWVAGGIPAAFSMAHDGIDTNDKTTRYILIFVVILLLILFAHCDHDRDIGYFGP